MRSRIMLVIALLLAGCASPDAASPVLTPGPSGPLPTARSIEILGCVGIEAVVPVPYSEAASTLPEGYTPAPYPFDATGSQAALVTETLLCEDALVDNASAQEGALGFSFAFLQVVAPEGSGGDAEFQVVAYHTLVSSARVGGVLADWGARELHAAEITVTPTQTGAADAVQASAISEDGLSIESRGVAPRGETEAYVVRVHDATKGGPLYEVFIETSPASLGQGGATLEGAPFDGGEGVAFVRPPMEGRLATFRPVVLSV